MDDPGGAVRLEERPLEGLKGHPLRADPMADGDHVCALLKAKSSRVLERCRQGGTVNEGSNSERSAEECIKEIRYFTKISEDHTAR